MVALFVSLLLQYSICTFTAQAQPVIVPSEYGDIEGHTITDVFNGEFTADVVSFLGIPYAKSTEGNRRFAKPEKLDSFENGTFVADTLGRACPQSGGTLWEVTHPGWDYFGEDCLNLNIAIPKTTGPHPVMVWFYGGGFVSGGNVQYPAHFLATRDIVVVTANYRINHFGFAFTNTSACPGNFGLWDQKLALEFVRDNIANFGGDPSRVTIFGQSAGAASSSLLMVSPQTQGLMHQAILESGTESNLWSMNWPESSPENYIWEVASQLNCTEGGDDVLMIECLRQLPWETVYNTRFKCTPGHFCQGMAPVVDGPGGFLPQTPNTLRASGSFLQGPIITGITKDDASLYTALLIPESLQGGFNHSEFLYYLENRLIGIWAPMMDEVTTMDINKAIEFNYSPWPYIEDEDANREAFNQLITDVAFGTPWDIQMKNQYEYGPTYGYVYDYRSIPILPEWMGVPHMSELIPVWGYALLPDNPAVKEDTGISLDRLINFTAQDVEHAVHFQTMISNFAHEGNPTPEPVPDPFGGSTTWRTFAEEDMAYLYLSKETSDVRTLYEQQDFAFWREYIDWIAGEYPLPITGRSTRLSDMEGLWSDTYEQAIQRISKLMIERGDVLN